MSPRAAGAPRAPVDPRLVAQVRPAAGPLGAAVALGIVGAAAFAVQAVLLARLVAGAFPGSPPAGSRVDLLVGFAGASAVRAFCAFASELAGRRAASRVKATLRAELVSGSIAPRSVTGAGELATVAGRGLDALDAYVGRYLPDLVLAAVVPMLLVAVVAFEDWVSGVVVVVAVTLFPIFGALVGRSTGTMARARWREVAALGDHLVDLFAGLPVLRAYGRVPRERDRVRELGERLVTSSLSTLRVAFLSSLVLDTLASVSTALVAVPIGLRLAAGSMRLAPGLAVLVVTPEVFAPLRRASSEFHESAEGAAAAARALDLIEAGRHERAGTGGARAEPADRSRLLAPGGVPVASRATGYGPPQVSLDAVTVRRDAPSRAKLLDEVSLELAPGEVVALVGPNGAGKSTVCSVVLGLVAPEAGEVSVDGVPLRPPGLEAWRRRVAYLPDRPTILPGTLEENLRLAAPFAPGPALSAVVEELALGSLLARLPGGLAARVGEGGWSLSAGERQRVALARALLRDAAFYVLDEPTEHLDGGAEAVVLEAIGRRLRAAGGLLVTHRPAALRLADRVVELRGGRVVAAPDAVASELSTAASS